MGTMKRNKMIHDVKAAESSQGLQGASLEKRLQTFGMQMVEMAGDGNCQFRTMAFNLFRSQEHHAAVRQSAVAHMRKHADFFGVFFEDEAEFGHYCKNMALHGTWGDELTLRAVVEAYGCIAHVITSEPTNWQLGRLKEFQVGRFQQSLASCVCRPINSFCLDVHHGYVFLIPHQFQELRLRGICQNMHKPIELYSKTIYIYMYMYMLERRSAFISLRVSVRTETKRPAI
ncbi:OVARIAN TUMOR DOMAIN-containing deubiquitinating enzyme 11 (OTU domain-containing protein 11) (Deubiquitinating enzyme OTU11) [Durusdinium trenchii]|uniref:OVARIAN TUMOR DOMAIN-containing deubiquitinating enzyme 11 (OTU domain-containing protein 11) (Deubiquitinating enzyme OTU11) n=1 Tax=Durusdinium trenchii TaxID=1381693 RepID=A0ABP0S5J5_9DINO